MMRNHRHFVEAVVACAKLGASSLFMNTMFSGPQLAEVAEREAPKALIYDEEFAELLEGVGDLDRSVSSTKTLRPAANWYTRRGQ
jgi:acyl-CoA synthetase (AMP-forming)/AMP-acid ligase II